MRNLSPLVAIASLTVASACALIVGFPDVPTSLDDAGREDIDSGSHGASSSGNSSSGTSSSGTSTSSSSSSSSSGSSSSGTSSSGCPGMDTLTEGTRISFPVGWPNSTLGTAGTGNVSIWFLTKFMVVGNALTGASQLCGVILPDLVLNTTGMAAAGGGATKLNIQIGPTTLDKINRTFPVTGTQTGWNTGDTQTFSPSLDLLGLTDAAVSTAPAGGKLNVDTTAWPPYCTNNCTPSGSFNIAALLDDDGDGNPGITAYPLTNPGYTLPPTSSIFAEVADEVYIVLRIEIAISGKSTDCVNGKGTGTATVTLFDNHVVGCHATNPTGQNFGPPGPCTSAQVSFLDQDRTIYGYDQAPGASITKATAVTTSDVSVLRLPATSTCADVRSALLPQ